MGIPGALIAGYLVELPILGRRGLLPFSLVGLHNHSKFMWVRYKLSTGLTGVVVLASTTARTSNSYLAWDCAYSFTCNVMYGVLYALGSPESFPTKHRGTGNSLVSSANHIFGVMLRA